MIFRKALTYTPVRAKCSPAWVKISEKKLVILEMAQMRGSTDVKRASNRNLLLWVTVALRVPLTTVPETCAQSRTTVFQKEGETTLGRVLMGFFQDASPAVM